MSENVTFDIEPTPVDRVKLKGVLSESTKRDQEFEDHREHYLTIDELPDRLSEGLSEDKRRKYDVTYFLRKRNEEGKRYQVQVSEHSNAINRSLVFELKYFDPAEEDVERGLSRLLDSIKRVVEELDDDRYDEYRLSESLYGVELEPLYEQDTTPEIEDRRIASEDGRLLPENVEKM